MSLRDKARKLFGRDDLSEHSVVASKIQHVVFEDVAKRSTAVSDALEDLPRLPNGDVLDSKVWRRAAEDLWSQFYGMDDPQLRERQKIDPRFRINREVAAKNVQSEKFSELHAKTRGEIAPSALGVMGALGALRDEYAGELGEHAARANDIADTEDALDSLDERMEQLRQTRGELADASASDEEMRKLASQKRQLAQDLAERIETQKQHAGDMQDAVARAVGKAANAADEAIEMAALTKGAESGPGGARNIDAALALADRIRRSRKLKNVLELLGRIELSMGTIRRQLRKGGYEEMVDIELGNELRNVLPAEKMLLMHPVGRLDFFRRFLERSLMQYEMWSLEETKKGPIIVGADGSGSMSGAPDECCRAITLSCLDIANREHRNAAAIEFGWTGELREFWFPGDQPFDATSALDFAEHFFAGGTDINQVLERAVQLIDNEAPFHSADLVIVTDGGDYVTERTIELRDHLREMGVKIHGIAINSAPTAYLLEVCDNVSSLFDFSGPSETSDRLAINLT
jgi:uncharacterized protein with von Willebrand factor type A (vWA) domain